MRLLVCAGAALALLAGGCGGGDDGGSGSSTGDAAKAVEAFIAAVDEGDHKAVCGKLADLGRTQLSAEVLPRLPDPEAARKRFLDDFGAITDCPAFAAAVREVLAERIEGTKLGRSKVVAETEGFEQVLVESNKGDWGVVRDGEEPWKLTCIPPGCQVEP